MQFVGMANSLHLQPAFLRIISVRKYASEPVCKVVRLCASRKSGNYLE